MNVDAIFHVINGFHCHLCVNIPISTTGLDEIQVLLTNRGMFGTYIRWGSQMQGLCNLIPHDKRVWAPDRLQDGGNYQQISPAAPSAPRTYLGIAATRASFAIS